MNIASYIDHTLLKPAVTADEIRKLCTEAVRYQFAAVCVPPPMIALCRSMLAGTSVKIATVIGFPFGYAATAAKLEEIREAISSGCDELDVVINLIHLKAGNWDALEAEMKEIISLAHDQGKRVKVIIESGILSDEEIISCCRLYSRLGVDFLKTSTGYAEKGATIEAVALMKKNLPAEVRIKASGGIRTYAFARQLIEAGASRLGCSASLAILAEAPRDQQMAHGRIE